MSVCWSTLWNFTRIGVFFWDTEGMMQCHRERGWELQRDGQLLLMTRSTGFKTDSALWPHEGGTIYINGHDRLLSLSLSLCPSQSLPSNTYHSLLPFWNSKSFVITKKTGCMTICVCVWCLAQSVSQSLSNSEWPLMFSSEWPN